MSSAEDDSEDDRQLAQEVVADDGESEGEFDKVAKLEFPLDDDSCMSASVLSQIKWCLLFGLWLVV